MQGITLLVLIQKIPKRNILTKYLLKVAQNVMKLQRTKKPQAIRKLKASKWCLFTCLFCCTKTNLRIKYWKFRHFRIEYYTMKSISFFFLPFAYLHSYLSKFHSRFFEARASQRFLVILSICQWSSKSSTWAPQISISMVHPFVFSRVWACLRVPTYM